MKYICIDTYREYMKLVFVDIMVQRTLKVHTNYCPISIMIPKYLKHMDNHTVWWDNVHFM